jgi:hypothetical protein
MELIEGAPALLKAEDGNELGLSAGRLRKTTTSPAAVVAAVWLISSSTIARARSMRRSPRRNFTNARRE